MDGEEQLDLLIKSTEKQIELSNRVLENAIDAADRIHARNASQTIIDLTKQAISDPITATL